jgi:RND family efflux transporter MFP subunit
MFWNKIAVLGVSILLVSCGGEAVKKTAVDARPAVSVRTAPVTAEDWPAGVELTGEIRARTSTEIAARVMGYVREIRVRVGDSVAAGQVLATIDSRELESAARQAANAETEARSAIAEVDNAAKSAKARLDLARATHRRMQDLFAKNSLSRQEMDEADMRLHVAEADADAVVSRRKQLDSKIAQAQESVKLAQVNSTYAEIRAPFAGLITARKAEPGTLASPGAPLLTLEQAGAYRAEISVDESKLREVKVGTPLTLSIEALDRTIETRVTEVVPSVDAGSRAFLVKAEVSGAGLRSGMFVRARLHTGQHRTLTAPGRAIRRDGQLEFAMVADQGVARERMIRTGETREGRVEVLSGLQEGDRVITNPPAGLRDGDKVSPDKVSQ